MGWQGRGLGDSVICLSIHPIVTFTDLMHLPICCTTTTWSEKKKMTLGLGGVAWRSWDPVREAEFVLHHSPFLAFSYADPFPEHQPLSLCFCSGVFRCPGDCGQRVAFSEEELVILETSPPIRQVHQDSSLLRWVPVIRLLPSTSRAGDVFLQPCSQRWPTHSDPVDS